MNSSETREHCGIRQITKKNKTQNTKQMNNTDPTKNRRMAQKLRFQTKCLNTKIIDTELQSKYFTSLNFR